MDWRRLGAVAILVVEACSSTTTTMGPGVGGGKAMNAGGATQLGASSLLGGSTADSAASGGATSTAMAETTGGLSTNATATGLATGGASSSVGPTSGVTGGATTTSTTPVVKSIALGNYHACALYDAGTVKCWGQNDAGQLGSNDTSAIPAPRAVGVYGITNARGIAAGGDGTCALLTDNSLKCWGRNGAGQVGDGTTVARYAPTAVKGNLTNVNFIALGTEHACALTGNGTAYCWGANALGQLGNGNTTQQTTPTPVPYVAFARLSASNHTCGVSTDAGGLWCWGYNNDGELGFTIATYSATPGAVNIGSVIGVSTGADSTCAILSTQAVSCWGKNDNGQLGNNIATYPTSRAPLSVAGISGATQIASASLFHCVLARSGSTPAVQCWGSNTWGQLGTPSSTTMSATPLTITNIGGTPAAVSVGFNHACALRTDGKVVCWGRNNYGQLGNDDTTVPLSPDPLPVQGL